MTPPPRRRLSDHPRGLWVLAGTEFWERVSFHGMQALLILYMAGWLFTPGHYEAVAGLAAVRAAVESVTGPLTLPAFAAQLFGLYVGLVYFAPVIGGWLGDRVTGRRRAVASGAALMTAGHFALAFDRSFLVALALLVAGAGLLRGNLSPQVTSLYADGDPREADGFQLYYVGINVGAFVAPILTGALAAWRGWHVGFAVAGLGMLIGLAVYLAGQRHLPPDPTRAAEARAARPLDPDERRRVLGLVALWPMLVCFWVAQSQVWNQYNLWVRDRLDLDVSGFAVPVPWLQALDGLAPVLVLPLFLRLWRAQAARGAEPDPLAKAARGCLIFGGGTAWLALAPLVAGADGRAPLLWAVAFHLLSNTGWLFFTPVVLALFADRAPESRRGLMIGVQSLAVFAGSTVSGRLGGLYERWAPADFWLLHAGIVAGGGVALLAAAPWLRRVLR